MRIFLKKHKVSITTYVGKSCVLNNPLKHRCSCTLVALAEADHLHVKHQAIFYPECILSNLSNGETFTQHTLTLVSMGTKQPLCFSIAWVCRGRRLLWWVCLGGQGAGWSVVSGGTVKQRTRQMKALHVLKSNHNLVISRRWYDQNKDENMRDGQDWERPECTSQDEGDVRLLWDGKWWGLTDRDGLIPKADAYLLQQSRYPGTGTYPKRVSKALLQRHCSNNTWTFIHMF